MFCSLDQEHLTCIKGPPLMDITRIEIKTLFLHFYLFISGTVCVSLHTSHYCIFFFQCTSCIPLRRGGPKEKTQVSPFALSNVHIQEKGLLAPRSWHLHLFIQFYFSFTSVLLYFTSAY